MDSWCHGSSPGRDPVTGQWVFNHMGPGVVGECKVCTSGVTPVGVPSGPCTRAPGAVDSSAALTSRAPTGPWVAAAGIVNGANCEPFFLPNGTLFSACPSGPPTTAPGCNGRNAFLSMHRADNLSAAIEHRWTELPVSYVVAGSGAPFRPESDICVNWEDQNLWVDPRGNFHTLMHAFRGQPTEYPICDRARNKSYCSALGGHAFSSNGYHWYVSPVAAYTPIVEFEGGATVTFRARERPHLIFQSDGSPSHLVTAVGDPGCGGNTGCTGADHTFTLIQPLGT